MRNLSRSTDPITSHIAASRVHEFRDTHQERILAVLRDVGPCGAEEISYHTDIPAYAIRKRLPELQRSGHVRLTGMHLKTTSGRFEREWVLIDSQG